MTTLYPPDHPLIKQLYPVVYAVFAEVEQPKLTGYDYFLHVGQELQQRVKEKQRVSKVIHSAKQ